MLLCPVSADDVQLINSGDNVVAVTESDHGADTVQTMFCVGQTKYHSQENIHKELILKSVSEKFLCNQKLQPTSVQ